jgi:predicted DNA-binding transcriptional regulator YafY
MPVSFSDLRSAVPAYNACASQSAAERMFERDKDELRSFGVPIETIDRESDGEVAAYRLRPQDFYLPFLAVSANGAAAPRKVPPEGYRSLESLAFEPDELAALSDAAARVRALGDPMLAADVESAMRKFAFDLPAAAEPEPGNERIVSERLDPKTFAKLGGALLGRKSVRFEYFAMKDGKTTSREVEPYGLVFLGSHWYLVARDRGRNALRNFRLSRMSGVSPNKTRANSADYEIPRDFRLEEAARSKESWKLGDDEEIEVTVHFVTPTGAVRAAAKLGEPVRGKKDWRLFRVRRPDHFARWLLSFGGDVMPLEPKDFVKRFKDLARATLALYEAAP